MVKEKPDIPSNSGDQNTGPSILESPELSELLESAQRLRFARAVGHEATDLENGLWGAVFSTMDKKAQDLESQGQAHALAEIAAQKFGDQVVGELVKLVYDEAPGLKQQWEHVSSPEFTKSIDTAKRDYEEGLARAINSRDMLTTAKVEELNTLLKRYNNLRGQVVSLNKMAGYEEIPVPELDVPKIWKEEFKVAKPRTDKNKQPIGSNIVEPEDIRAEAAYLMSIHEVAADLPPVDADAASEPNDRLSELRRAQYQQLGMLDQDGLSLAAIRQIGQHDERRNREAQPDPALRARLIEVAKQPGGREVFNELLGSVSKVRGEMFDADTLLYRVYESHAFSDTHADVMRAKAEADVMRVNVVAEAIGLSQKLSAFTGLEFPYDIKLVNTIVQSAYATIVEEESNTRSAKKNRKRIEKQEKLDAIYGTPFSERSTKDKWRTVGKVVAWPFKKSGAYLGTGAWGLLKPGLMWLPGPLWFPGPATPNFLSYSFFSDAHYRRKVGRDNKEKEASRNKLKTIEDAIGASAVRSAKGLSLSVDYDKAA